MVIDSEIKLHTELDKMFKTYYEDFYPKEPTEIGICESLSKYIKGMENGSIYRGVKVTVFKEWFAKGRVAII